jgi:hypothetical protein
VPNETTTIDFRFYDGPGGTGTVVQAASEPFAPTITIDPVTGAAQSVVVTARSPASYPLVQSTAFVDVIDGGEFTVDFATATTTPVTIDNFFVNPAIGTVAASGTLQINANLAFSNGEVHPANNVMWTATGQATVDNNGLATALNDGVATVTADRDGSMSTSNLTVGAGQVLTTITVAPDDPTVGIGSVTAFTATAVDQNGDPFTLTNVAWTKVDGTGSGAIELDGTFTANAIGDVTVTATQDAISDNSVVNILDTVPVVTLDMGTLAVTSALDPLAFSPGATVVDEQPNLNNGVLGIALDGAGQVTDAIFTVPGAPNSTIGVVTGDGTSTISIALYTNATPAAIEALLQTITITGNALVGNGTIQVDLSDGQGNDAMQATRAFTFFGNDLTVGATGDHATIQAAINAVAAADLGTPSRITVLADYAGPAETHAIGTDADLAGLTLLGNNAGVAFGVTPAVRNAETVVNFVIIDNTNVTFDGFEVSPVAGGGVFIAATASNITITNGHFDGPGNSIGITNNGDLVLVSDSFFGAWDQGVREEGATSTGSSYTGNAFVSNGRGLILADADGSQMVTGNGFSDSNDGANPDHLATSGTNTVTVTGNFFNNTGGLVAARTGGGTIDAQMNWWGADADPGGTQISGTVNFTPRLTTEPFAFPPP